MKIIMLILLVIGVLEIFFNIITVLLEKFIRIFNRNYKFSEKVSVVLKLFFIFIFLISVIFFLVEFVKVLAALFGISLDDSILDIFR